MDVIAGLGLMFDSSANEGNDSSSSSETTETEVKKLEVVAPAEVYYYDTVEQVQEVADYDIPHIIREVYADGTNRYYQLLINGLDTIEERVIGIVDLQTQRQINIVSEV